MERDGFALISIDEMRPQLLTIDEVKNRLEPTENLSEYEFETNENSQIKFDFPENWSTSFEDLESTERTGATVDIDGVERILTKSAVLKATKELGLSEKFVATAPSGLIQTNMDWWASNGNKHLKMLATPEEAVAFTRASITPFSNVEFLDGVVDVLQSTYGTDDILADYKFSNTLQETVVRLIVPSNYRDIGSARTIDAGNDPWSVGIELHNSITGAVSTQMHGYLFAWWCTNGATSTHVTSGKYRRTRSGTPEDMYEWARATVDDVLGGLESELDNVQSLTQQPLEGDLNELLGNMFEQFRVPIKSREEVLGNLAESQDLTLYGLLNSITAVANDPRLASAIVENLLQAAGRLLHANACEACGKF